MSNSPEDPSKRRKRRVRRSTGKSPTPGSTDHSAFTEGTPAQNLPAPGTSQPSRHDLSQSSESESTSRLAGFQRTTEDEDLKPKEGGDGRKRERVKEIRKNPHAMPDWDQEEEELSPLEAAREGMEKKEKSRRKRKEEPSPLETFFGKMSKVFYVFAGVVVLTLIALGTWGVFSAAKESNVEVPIPTERNSINTRSSEGTIPITKDEFLAATAAIESYLQADGWGNKIAEVSDEVDLEAKMLDWYSRPENMGSDSKKSIGDVLSYRRANIGNRSFVLVAAYVLPESEIQYFATQEISGSSNGENNSTPHFKVHWESTVGYQTVPRELFIGKKHLEPVQFRIAAVAADYYNGVFANPERYICLKLLYPGDPEFILWGYIDKESEFASELSYKLAVQPALTMIVNLRHRPLQSDESLEQAEITEIIDYSWYPNTPY